MPLKQGVSQALAAKVSGAALVAGAGDAAFAAQLI